MNNLLPSVQSFATLPYSLVIFINLFIQFHSFPQLTYHLALTFSNLAHTFANLFALIVHPRRLAILLPLIFICFLTSLCIFALALQSPDPIFRQTNPQIGSFIAVGHIPLKFIIFHIKISISILASFLCSFLRTNLTFLIRQENFAQSERYLRLCGIFMQVVLFTIWPFYSLIIFPF